jgi:tetratricopeptide (TPR) repeat protein
MAQVNAHRFDCFARRMKWRIRRLPARLCPVSRYFQRTSAYRSERLTVLLWSTLGLACAVALAGFGVLIGYGANSIHVNGAIDAIARTVTQTAVAVPIAFVLLIALGGSTRGARLGWLAWWPGPIVVSDFAQFGQIDETTPAQVTGLFRDNLSLLRLDSASPSPGAPAETSFLDVLKAGGVSSGDILSTLLSVLQASWPAHAFEVQGAIQKRDGPQPCGITVHALRLPNEPAGHLEVWAKTWDQAARQAADGVVAALLPRTRVCIGPWAYWRRYRLPVELLTAYRQAATFERERRYDEALNSYGNALELDPTNLTIALQQGQLLEKIGLSLGALTTYQRILALDTPGRQPVPRGVYSRAARREWRSAVSVAKYRQVVLLGQESLLREWFGCFIGDSKRYAKSLRDHFRRQLEPLTVDRGDPSADVIAQAIRTLMREGKEEGIDDPEAAVRTKQSALMPFAYQAAFELQRSLSRWERRPWERSVSRRTLGLALATLRWRAELAHEHAKSAREEPMQSERRPEAGRAPHAEPDPQKTINLVREFDSAARWAGISPAIWFGWRPAAGRRFTWQQHYAAACLYSTPLAVWHDDCERDRHRATQSGHVVRPAEPPPLYENLARHAVDRLERAAARADNAFVATRGDWVVEEDPELRGLRDFPEFNAFVIQYFPGREPAGARRYPGELRARVDRRSPARVAQTIYARSLLTAVALQWHDVWHQRAAQQQDLDSHTLKRWWGDERQIWALFEGVVSDWLSWEGRLALLSKANELLASNGTQPLAASYGYDGVTLASAARVFAYRPPGLKAPRATRTREFLSKSEATAFRRLALCAKEQFEERVRVLRRMDAESIHPMTPAQHTRICLLHAGVWQILGDWLSGEQADGQAAYSEALGCLEQASQLWGRAQRQMTVDD